MQYDEDLKLAAARLPAEWSSPSCHPGRMKDLVAEVLAAAESGIESRARRLSVRVSRRAECDVSSSPAVHAFAFLRASEGRL